MAFELGSLLPEAAAVAGTQYQLSDACYNSFKATARESFMKWQ